MRPCRPCFVCAPAHTRAPPISIGVLRLTRRAVSPYGHQVHPCREMPMPDRAMKAPDRATLRRMAISRWENEGGAGRSPLDAASASGQVRSADPPLTDAELVQLQIRVIALENLVITLLTAASDRQLDLAREMAAYISPRPGCTPHRLTIHAAAEMISLVDRASHFRDLPAASAISADARPALHDAKKPPALPQR